MDRVTKKKKDDNVQRQCTKLERRVSSSSTASCLIFNGFVSPVGQPPSQPIYKAYKQQ